MADRVHPRDSPVHEENTTKPPEDSQVPAKPIPSFQEKPIHPPGTYVVQIPKDQILRVPPPENARRYKKYIRRGARRNRCCCCLCWIFSLIALLIFLIGIAAGIFYLVIRPKAPAYSVENLSIKGFNLTSSAPVVSPEFNVTVRAQNPNKKIGIYYEKDSSVSISHSGVELSTGVLPVFYQPTKNVTVFQTALKGPSIQLTTEAHDAFKAEQGKGDIPLVLKLRVPARLKVGDVKTWTFTVKVNCDVTVDKLTVDSKIVSKSCDVDVKLW